MSIPSSRAASSIPISVASPRDFPARPGSSSAVLQDAAARPRSARTGFAATAAPTSLSPSRSTSPSGVQIRIARIRFSVSVPVLSVQITVVEPSVSTALRRLTRAPCRARVATPTASASVIVGNRPSGTFATISPIAKLSASCSGNPATSQPIGRNASPAATATSAISQATRRTCRSSGLGSTSTRSVRAAIRPSSVCIPVANTSPDAAPPTQLVPLKTTSRASSGVLAGPPRPAPRKTGCDSPVRVDRSTSTAPSRRRASAEILSPSSSRRTSPGTSVAASTSCASPSRSTPAC